MVIYKYIVKGLRWLAFELLPMLFWVMLILGFDKPYLALITILSALLHELGHYTAIYLLKLDTGMPLGHLTGLRIRLSGYYSYRDEIIVRAMGPAFNLIFGFLLLPFGDAMSGYIRTVAIVNITTAVANLLPVEGYDGYGILMLALGEGGRHTVIRALEGFSLLFISSVTLLSLYLIGRYDFGYWIFFLFFGILAGKLIKKLREGIF